jgi:class 3 adenylate cyclase
VAHEDDPERAVRAALAIADAIEELNHLDPSLGLAVRTGVNTGEAVVAYGSGPQIGEAVTGDVVNTAARLQGVARWAASSWASPPTGPPTGPCATSHSRR